MEYLRAKREKKYMLVTDPKPVEKVDDIWTSAAQMATIGLFVMAFGTCLYFSRGIVLPIVAALIVGTTLGPVIKRAKVYGIAPWMTALLLVAFLVGAAGIAVTLLAKPAADWIARAPEIGAALKQKLYVFDRPLAALADLQKSVMPAADDAVKVQTSEGLLTPVVALVTPALTQIMIFFVTLIFYLVGQMEMRREVALLFSSREAKLRFLRITNDVESNLTDYVALMTAINFALGVVVTIGAWLFGFPSPIIFGILAMVLNYLPYIGPAVIAVTLLGVGLVTFPSIAQALVPPACFVALTTIEGQFITPTILGHRLTLNPLAVFIAIAFWAWLWGPFGAFLAVPLSIVGVVIFNHVFPAEENKLPG